MLSHELAKKLLALPNLPIATHSDNHTYMSGHDTPSQCKIGLLETYNGDHIIVGNISRRNLNGGTNWHITKMFYGKAPENWGE